MALPRAVVEQAARAEATHLALIGNTAPAAPVVQAPAPPVEVVEEVKPVAPVVAPPVVEPNPPVEATVPDSWELKFKVLQGKYNAEVPSLAAKVRTLTEQLQEALDAQAAPQAAPAPAPTSGLTPDAVRAQYGDDFANAVTALAAAQVAPLAGLPAKVEEMGVGAAERARNDFIRDLGALVPSWQEIDREAGFTAYLDEFDPQTGSARRAFFNDADKRNDAHRIASFFAAYARGKQPVPTPPVPAAVPSAEHLVVPDSSRRSEAPPGKKQWTSGEVNKFYADARSQGGKSPYGIYTQAQFEQIDADINAAIAEGRIRG